MGKKKKKKYFYEDGGNTNPMDQDIGVGTRISQVLSGLGGTAIGMAPAFLGMFSAINNVNQDDTAERIRQLTVSGNQGFMSDPLTFQFGGAPGIAGDGTIQVTDIRGMRPLYGLFNQHDGVKTGTYAKKVVAEGAENVRIPTEMKKGEDVQEYGMGGTPPGRGVQTAKGEALAFSDGTVVNTRAQKTHKGMDDDDVTDIVPPGGYIYSNDKKMRISKKEAEEMEFGYSPLVYGEEGNYSSMPKEITLADVFGGNKTMTPADAAKAIRSKYKLTDLKKDAFAEFTRRENLASRMPRLQALAQMNESKKPSSQRMKPPEEEEEVDEYECGGKTKKYMKGGKTSKYKTGGKTKNLGSPGEFGYNREGNVVRKPVNNIDWAAISRQQQMSPRVPPVTGLNALDPSRLGYGRDGRVGYTPPSNIDWAGIAAQQRAAGIAPEPQVDRFGPDFWRRIRQQQEAVLAELGYFPGSTARDRDRYGDVGNRMNPRFEEGGKTPKYQYGDPTTPPGYSVDRSGTMFNVPIPNVYAYRPGADPVPRAGSMNPGPWQPDYSNLTPPVPGLSRPDAEGNNYDPSQNMSPLDMVFSSIGDDMNRLRGSSGALNLAQGALGTFGPFASMMALSGTRAPELPIDILRGLPTRVPQFQIDRQANAMGRRLNAPMNSIIANSSNTGDIASRLAPLFAQGQDALSNLYGNTNTRSQQMEAARTRSLFDAISQQRQLNEGIRNQRLDNLGGAISNSFSNAGNFLGGRMALGQTNLQNRIGLLGALLNKQYADQMLASGGGMGMMGYGMMDPFMFGMPDLTGVAGQAG